MENNTEALVLQGETAVINQSTIQQMKAQYDLLRKFTTSVLEEGKDFGNIPGIDKPSLFQSGAISLKIAYGLAEDAPILASVIQHLEKNPPYVEYIVRQDIRSIKTGLLVSSAMASCNSYEDKYRFRWIPEWKLSEEQKKIKSLQPNARRKKKDGSYFIVYRFDNDDIFSQFNTILQMAEKRAFVRAIRQAVPGASKLYTQDVEDFGITTEEPEWEVTNTGHDPDPKIDYKSDIIRLMEVTGYTSDYMKSLSAKHNWKSGNTQEGLKERYEFLLGISQIAGKPTEPKNLTPEAPQSNNSVQAVVDTPKEELLPEASVEGGIPEKFPYITASQAKTLEDLCTKYSIDLENLKAEFFVKDLKSLKNFEYDKAIKYLEKIVTKQKKG